MAGVRRRLREVVTGALGVRPVEPDEPAATAAPDPGPEPAPVQNSQTLEAAPDAPSDVPLQPEPDRVLAAAVALAREVAVEVGGSAVGEHLGAVAEGDELTGPVVTHRFATTEPAYVGWHWAVTVARAEGSEHVTVDEVVLLPGSSAVLAPAWVPWSERVRAEDLSPGDLLPPAEADPRLVPAYASDEGDDADLADQLWFELGLGRERVLSQEGIADAADRWWDGETGPNTKMARSAPGTCGDCGFLVTLTGSLRRAFGVCANDRSPSDGRVVALPSGCGAFSETTVDSAHASLTGMAVEDDEFEVLSSVDLV